MLYEEQSGFYWHTLHLTDNCKKKCNCLYLLQDCWFFPLIYCLFMAHFRCSVLVGPNQENGRCNDVSKADTWSIRLEY